MSATTASQRNRSDPAESWVAEDVAFLEELTHLGMDLARDLTRRVTADGDAADRGEAEQLTPAQCARAAARFARIARGVRLTLILKARVRAGDPPPGQPGPLREALRRYILSGAPQAEDTTQGDAQDTAQAEDLKTAAPARLLQARDEVADAERLIETLERELDRECDRERFAGQPLETMLGQICRDLGLAAAWRALKSEDGEVHAWVATHREAPTVSFVWPHKHPPQGLFSDSGVPAQARAPPLR